MTDKFAAIFNSNLDSELLGAAFAFDSDSRSLTIDTSDETFAEETVTVTVSVSELDSAQVLSTTPLRIQISFIREAAAESLDGIDFPESGEEIPESLLFDMT